jgi:acetolactate synthase-1/2/3 large subunit
MEQVMQNVVDEQECAQFFAMLGEAKRPLIYAGGGVINCNASPQLRAFADEFGIPVVTTLMGIGAYDTTQPLAMRMLGMHGAAFANYAVDDCDFVAPRCAVRRSCGSGPTRKFAPEREAYRISMSTV